MKLQGNEAIRRYRPEAQVLSHAVIIFEKEIIIYERKYERK